MQDTDVATEQAPPVGPENPALQVQFVNAALLAGELEFDGQAMHVEVAEAPTAVEYVPSPQLVHRAAETSVKSTPRTMRSAMAEVASVLRYSSTTKTPAMSPLKYASDDPLLLPM
jgi:hypothetical protein